MNWLFLKTLEQKYRQYEKQIYLPISFLFSFATVAEKTNVNRLDSEFNRNYKNLFAITYSTLSQETDHSSWVIPDRNTLLQFSLNTKKKHF